MKLRRRRTDAGTGVTSTETVYAITSLGHRYADRSIRKTHVSSRSTVAELSVVLIMDFSPF